MKGYAHGYLNIHPIPTHHPPNNSNNNNNKTLAPNNSNIWPTKSVILPIFLSLARWEFKSILRSTVKKFCCCCYC